MGFFGGGGRASTGGGGGVGPAGRKTSGTYGTKKDAKKTSNRNEFSSAAKKVGNFLATGGITGAIVRGITQGSSKKNKTSKSGNVYGGEAYGYNEAKEKIDYKTPSILANGSGNDNKPQGIELAKVATGTATVKGPAEIQKTAANTIPLKLSAAEINIANKRKGRKSTNLTSKKTLDKNYTLSKKSLLG